ncbi:MAG: hypothetical protein V1820_03200 [archaeon]
MANEPQKYGKGIDAQSPADTFWDKFGQGQRALASTAFPDYLATLSEKNAKITEQNGLAALDREQVKSNGVAAMLDRAKMMTEYNELKQGGYDGTLGYVGAPGRTRFGYQGYQQFPSIVADQPTAVKPVKTD